ncbi:MAG: ATP-binding protein [Desulfuromonadaceae bacterium]
MSEKKEQPCDSAELRRLAEARLGENTGMAHPPGTEEDPLRLHHELQVHQVELEMQNAELRHVRDELETALEMYTDLYDFAPVGYFTLDSKGTICRVNLTGAGLVGVERSRLVGQRLALFVTVEARPSFNNCLEEIFTNPAKVACEVALLQEGNAPLFVLVEGVASASGQECRIALIDITGRKRAEEALHLAKEAAASIQLAKETAEENSRLKNQFLVNMSHELRTPMTGILGMLRFALEEDLSPVLREYLETAQSSAQSLLRILSDILDMAKFEAGKLIIEEKPFSPRRCIAEAVDIITPEIRRKGLDIALSLAEEVPDTVAGDQMRLRQVLINLIDNAVKFTERGKVVVRVTTGKAASDGKRQFTFAVTDTGIGIPDDKKELIFRAFSQVDASLSRMYGGTGLGLAISREIVELMGGTISFVSEEGVGSTFSFTIPLEEARPESETLYAHESQPSKRTTITGSGEMMPRILLAEDDPVSRQIFGMMLKRAKYNIDIAEDGLKAIELWGQGGYDLVLMDVQMPGLNGFEATRVIREKEREGGGHTPIVAMTAHARKEDEENCLAAGMDAYISKPIDIQKSLQVIGNIIKQKAEEYRGPTST